MAFHATAILVLLTVGGWGLWQAVDTTIGPVFLLYLLPTLLAVVMVPLLGYRAYALQGAFYTLEREGIHLHWGLRSEDIPMVAVLWVRPADDFRQSLTGKSMPLPRLRWPGAVLGTRRLSDGNNVEFLAANSNQLVMIATKERIFAISPSDIAAFVHTYQRCLELGSLTPISARSVYPTFLLARVWEARLARYLLLGGLGLSLILFAWVSLIASSRPQIALGFTPIGGLREPVAGVRLFLLPIISTFFFMVDVILGLFFYRQNDKYSESPPNKSETNLVSGQVIAYLLWGTGTLTPALFLIAVYLILQAT